MSEEKITIDRLNFQSRGTSVSDRIRVTVCPTTGGQIELRSSGLETIQGLKWMIARKLKIAPEKITLLHKDRTLKNGTLHENHITDCSQITLLPNMESGMTFQRTDSSVIQALENLSESQINDFLTGRAPLLLAMRVGDHMMFVQLQLSTSQCAGRRSKTIKSMTTPTTSGHNLFPSTSSLSSASLAEASRNLSQKLHQLSRVPKDNDKNKNCELKEQSKSQQSSPVHTSPIPLSTPLTPPSSRPSSPQTQLPRAPVHPTPPATPPVTPPVTQPVQPTPTNLAASGAVINSMNHLGKGVFSGTFSGTLDPTLQDQNGKPKKDVNTIVHILNDLLGVNAYQLVHPYVQIRAPGARKPEYKSTTPNNESPVVNANDDESLKEKVQHLQQMMHERKLKRKARREMKGPYQWNTEQIVSTPLSTFKTVNIETAGSTSTTCSSTDSKAMEITEGVENSAYLNSNIEHESLAV
ncbi:hypothetical protein LOTGIDRAFT_233061 [Lottia gigantea]|uniref:Ubiquitin-like domain-containing protein n=1 Tax=Lottia gigantea TaxID=225164 RepID=V4BU99_LOTGI|nr:hypothetical protein LOTGIDRAFT_233061 [Lottia gigantea]ESO92614.1 hypothetical protein LOTGIDRAFT_233061 [Lottia gigantea]